MITKIASHEQFLHLLKTKKDFLLTKLKSFFISFQGWRCLLVFCFDLLGMIDIEWKPKEKKGIVLKYYEPPKSLLFFYFNKLKNF